MNSTSLADEFPGYMALIRCAALFHRAVDQALAEHGDLTRVQFAILSYLSTNPEGLRMFELADRMVHSRNGLTYQIKQLEKTGLVTRSPGTNNERAVVAKITEEGHRIHDSLLAQHSELVRTQFFDVLSAEELATITNGLDRVAKRLDEYTKTHTNHESPKKDSPA